MTDALLDLVAVAYNAPTELREFLVSVVFQVDTPFTLTVIDNNSPDTKVQEILAEFSGRMNSNPMCRSSRFILNQENVGYARAINFGVSMGQAPYVGALNCDVQFKPKSASKIVREFQQPNNGAVGILGPKTVNWNNQLTHAGIITTDKGDRHRWWMQPNSPKSSDELMVPTVSGATYFIRRSIWDELTACERYRSVAPDAQGAFLPTQHYYEETWCSYHARAHGHLVKYQGNIEMIHNWHRSSAIGSISTGDAEEYFRKACAAHDIELTW